jgi:hypothetical protein
MCLMIVQTLHIVISLFNFFGNFHHDSKIFDKAFAYLVPILYNLFVCNLRIFKISLSVCPWQAFTAYSYKHSSLVWKSVNYGQKKFHNIGPWCQSYKSVYTCNLHMLVVS